MRFRIETRLDFKTNQVVAIIHLDNAHVAIELNEHNEVAASVMDQITSAVNQLLEHNEYQGL